MKICTKCKINKEEEAFSLRSKETGRKHSICKNCQKIYKIEHYHNNKPAHYARNRTTQTKLRAIVLESKKVGCKYCEEKESCCLDFHHLYDKKYLISQMHLMGSKSKLLEELKKCEVLCANCHRKLHNGVL